MSDKLKATVTVTLGVTKNVGNFESVRYDVGLTLEGERGKEDELYQYANEWVGKKVNEFNGKKQ